MSMFVSREAPRERRRYGQRRLNHTAVELDKKLVEASRTASPPPVPVTAAAAAATGEGYDVDYAPGSPLQGSPGRPGEAAGGSPIAALGSSPPPSDGAARALGAANAARARAAREKRAVAKAAEKAKKETAAKAAKLRAAAAAKKKADAAAAKKAAAARVATEACKPHPKGCVTPAEAVDIRRKMGELQNYLSGSAVKPAALSLSLSLLQASPAACFKQQLNRAACALRRRRLRRANHGSPGWSRSATSSRRG